MKLEHKRVAILTENGFEQSELTSPKTALEKEGAQVDILSSKSGKVRAWHEKDWGIELDVTKKIADADPGDYDALLLPGGVMNPDKLRTDKDAVAFAKTFLQSGKTVAAICHGPQTLIETGLLKGKTMTSFPSLQTDLRNAGATWEDKELVTDGNLITSRRPDDLPAFNDALVKALSGIS
ncbi:type 1 glutamine amidotransferase domain-containing protein [Chitinophagaceae bacterium MMS25-I14]